jgi:glutathione synthase/RimK-type ligase-like ATP-grasp enzyme
MDPESASFAASEARALVNTLYALPNINWVNDPFIASRSKVKFQQLILASKYGVTVPSTILTNLCDEAKSFFHKHHQDVAAKSIYTSNVTIDGQDQGIPTSRIGPSEFVASYESIAACPTQFQEYIKKAFELRITVIGDNVFAVKIDSQIDSKSEVDWRPNAKALPHSVYELPERIREFCTKFISSQGLVYGAMDFIVTPKKEYVFLENNPFGQYLWLELETGLPLTATMAEYLKSLNSEDCQIHNT